MDFRTLVTWVQEWDGAIAVLAIFLLPLTGFPVTVTNALAGLRFGWTLGLGVVIAAELFHLAGSALLVHVLPLAWRRRVGRWRAILPPLAPAPLAQFVLLLPGAPYSAKNYLLPLLGIPLRVVLTWGIPIHTLRALVAIWVGRFGSHQTWENAAALATYALVVTVWCGSAFRRMLARAKGRPIAAGDRTPVG